MTAQVELDRQNEAFWSELCGSGLARSLGITGERAGRAAALRRSLPRLLSVPAGLRRPLRARRPERARDRARLRNAQPVHRRARRCLSRARHRAGARRDGAAPAADAGGSAIPSACVRARRSRSRGRTRRSTTSTRSAACTTRATSQRAVDEVHRVLKPGGVAVVMLYNRHSARRLWADCARDRRPRSAARTTRTRRASPRRTRTSRRGARRGGCSAKFSNVEIEAQNFDDITLRGRTLLSSRARAPHAASARCSASTSTSSRRSSLASAATAALSHDGGRLCSSRRGPVLVSGRSRSSKILNTGG